MPRTNFRSHYPRGLHIRFGFDWPSGFGGEDVCKCEWTDDDGRTLDHGYPISSQVSLWLRRVYKWKIMLFELSIIGMKEEVPVIFDSSFICF